MNRSAFGLWGTDLSDDFSAALAAMGVSRSWPPYEDILVDNSILNPPRVAPLLEWRLFDPPDTLVRKRDPLARTWVAAWRRFVPPPSDFFTMHPDAPRLEVVGSYLPAGFAFDLVPALAGRCGPADRCTCGRTPRAVT